MRQWAVEVSMGDPAGSPSDKLTPDAVGVVLAELRLHGAVATVAQDGSRYWVLLSVEAPSVAQAESQAAKLVRQAAKAAGLPAWPLVGIEVVPAEDLASRPKRELPTLVGTAEAARMLGVSKTRIKQIMQENRRFPVPVAHLAAGPVWIEDEIREFAKLPRTPGRPSKEEVDREQARMEDIAGVRARQRYRLAPEDRL
jgi:hypothetical protein